MNYIATMLVGIPIGYFLERDRSDLMLYYLFIGLGLFTASAIVMPEKIVSAVEQLGLAEYVVGVFTTWFGMGVGYIISRIQNRLKND